VKSARASGCTCEAFRRRKAIKAIIPRGSPGMIALLPSDWTGKPGNVAPTGEVGRTAAARQSGSSG
jgi:hypothetical protein